MNRKRKRREKRDKIINRIKQEDRNKAPASNFFTPLDHIPRGHVKNAVILLRVSSESQKSNLRYQDYGIKRKLKKKGIKVVKTVEEVASGKQIDRPKFRRAVKLATKYGAIIVAESNDRFLRSAKYSKTNQDATPTEDEFRELMRVTQGVQLATYLDPDLGWKDVRRSQSIRKQEIKGEWVGRPKKQAGRGDPERKKMLLLKVRWMLWVGAPLKNIAEVLGVSHTTVMNLRNELEGKKGLNFHKDYLRKTHIKHVDK